ncbi:hypothetical protein HDU79_000092 [Rhizoclosmatium sp. JEL0117]|nr:hypothetical protein HDU79_000092 [Rhizoclosmatium sp. JEL0117]
MSRPPTPSFSLPAYLTAVASAGPPPAPLSVPVSKAPSTPGPVPPQAPPTSPQSSAAYAGLLDSYAASPPKQVLRVPVSPASNERPSSVLGQVAQTQHHLQGPQGGRLRRVESVFSSFSRPYNSGSQAAVSEANGRVLTGSDVSLEESIGEDSDSRELTDFETVDAMLPPSTDVLPAQRYVVPTQPQVAPLAQQSLQRRPSLPNNMNWSIPPSTTLDRRTNYTSNNDDSSDDEAPLGLVAAQYHQNRDMNQQFVGSLGRNSAFIDRLQQQQQQSLLQQPPSSQPQHPQPDQPSLSNLLTSLATNSRVLDHLENATDGDLENLEGIVGQIDLLIKSRKDASIKETTSIPSRTNTPFNTNSGHNSSHNTTVQPQKLANSTPKLKLEELLKKKETFSDSEEDDVPLAQIQSKVVNGEDSSMGPRSMTRQMTTGKNIPPGSSRHPGMTPKQSTSEFQQQATLSSSAPTRNNFMSPKPVPAVIQPPPPTKPEPKKITTRIYIDSLATYKTVILTSALSTDVVVNELLYLLTSAPSSTFVDDGSYTLFEVCADFGIERALRDWEIVTDVMEAWDPTTQDCVLMLKPYAFRNTLVPRCVIGKWPRVEGRFDVEIKMGKWKRRWVYLREDVVYYKDREFDRETVLCRLNNFDVYTLTTPRKKATTNYCFALRSTASVTMFEKTEEYIHFFCVENKDQLADWVLGIRLAKNEAMFAEYPDLFTAYENVPARNQPPLKAPIVSAAMAQVSTAPANGATLLDPVDLGQVTNTTAVPPSMSLLGRNLSLAAKKKDATQQQQTHTQQVPSKPLLSFNQITNYQTPITTDNNNQQQSQAAIDDTIPLLVVRQKSKGVARTPTTNPKLVSTPVIPSTPFPNPAFDADAQIMEACDMPLSTIPTTIDTYDDTYVTRMQQYLDRAWELEQSQTLSFIAEAGGEVPSATSASVPTLSRGKSKRGNAAGGSGTLGRTAGKPLIDVSDSKNCGTCGCSEFKVVFNSSGFGTTKDGKKICGNCRHAHK